MQVAIARASQALEAGRNSEAVAILRQAASLYPRHPAPALELGKLLLNGGRPQEALPCIDHALALQPGVAQTQLHRGLALEQLGWHAEAAASYQRAIDLAPRLAEAHARLGVVLTMQEKRQEAAASFRRAFKLAPSTPLGQLSEAYGLMAEGKAVQAQAALCRTIALDPKNAPAHAELGKLLAEAGRAQEARAAFEQAVRLDPSAAGHYYELVRIRRLAETDRPLIERMQDTARRSDLQDIHRIMLELAIGRAFDDLGDAEQAMRHYLAANARKSRIRPLDRNMITKRVDWAISTFTPEYLAGRANGGNEDSTPIIILGMPRSGTTLVESVLASHSRVAAGQELPYWGRSAKPIAASGGRPDGEALDGLAAAYLSVLRAISDAPHVTDKKPDNFFWAGLIHTAFPRARIVHCRRNALDTCVSILANFFAPRPDFSTAPGDLVYYYREYDRLMAHWRSVLPPDRFLEIDYETLVADPEPAIRRLLEFCGLDWEEACRHPERSGRTVNTPSLWQVRQPISAGSIGRWERYASWLGELMALKH